MESKLISHSFFHVEVSYVYKIIIYHFNELLNKYEIFSNIITLFSIFNLKLLFK